MSNLVMYEAFVDECTSMFLSKLEGISQSGKTINVPQWFQYYAFDVIGMITLSSRFGFLDRGSDVGGLINTLDQGNLLLSIFGLWNTVSTFILSSLQSLGFGPVEFRRLFDMISKRIAYCKAQRQASPDNKSEILDFIQRMLITQAEHPKRVADGDILVAAAANVTAGPGTTFISLKSIFNNLMRSPEAACKLRDELDIAYLEGRRGKQLTLQQARPLPCLQAVIRESLRVHPATGYTMPRVVSKGGKVLAGHFFPEGTVVGVKSWVAYANQSVWRPNAEQFKPERWLTTDQAQLKLQESNFMTIGQGSRTCIGKNISLREMTKVVPAIVQRYDLTPAMEQTLTAKTHWSTKPEDFWCFVRRRAID